MTGTAVASGPAPAPPGGEAAAPVAVLGDGRLAAAIRAALAGGHAPPVSAAAIPARSPGWAALVVAGDGADESGYARLGQDADRHRLPWLPVRVDGGWVLVGPLVRPPVPLCPLCVSRRRQLNRADAAGRRALRQRYAAEPDRPSGALTPVLAATVAAVVAGELAALARPPAAGTAAPAPRTAGALLRISVTDGRVLRHPVLADPLCPRCARLPADTRADGDLRLPPVPKPDPRSFRGGRLTDRFQELVDTYVEAETGVVHSLATADRGGAAVAVARLHPAVADHGSQHGYGRTGDYASAQLTALAEALERLSGIHPRGRRTAVRAAYQDVAAEAVDPRTLGLYPPQWYDQPESRFRRFDPAAPIRWVWGHSFTRGEPVLVPESYAYYGYPGPDTPVHAFECSNGCALGGSLTEAVFYGLLEIAERDAFLLTWYARLPLRRVDLDSATDRRIPVAAARLRQRLGYQVRAYDATVEQRVPALWVMAVDAVGGPERPKLICAAAAHPDPERALLATITELGPSLAGLRERYDAGRAAAMLADASLVREMDEHSLLYGHPGAYPRLAFLRPDAPVRGLPELVARAAWPAHRDLADDLAELVARYLATGLDVVAVDTTAAEHAAAGFASAKVIVPGTVPMTFGHHVRRVHDLPRLLRVPRLLGHRDTDLRPEELNPHPHPFP